MAGKRGRTVEERFWAFVARSADCGESWTIDEQEQAAEDWVTYKDKYPRHPDDI